MIRNRFAKRRGAAMMEFALLCPFVCFLFIGAIDWGFYAYCLISLETATRSAALYEGTQNNPDSASACTIVVNELSTLVNLGSTSSCGASPLVVSASKITGPDNLDAAQVSVTYTTPNMIPIPGVLSKQFTITRVVTMKIG